MTDRGLPIVDGAPACPFVALEEDRDARSASPDHRHRCYAEVRPAPRALAHQEAYCLSSAFPVCPTFQDWARREAARAPEPVPPPPEAPSGEARRNPHRDWAAPPPWLAGEEPAGLSGSVADRLASGAPLGEPAPKEPAAGRTSASAASGSAASVTPTASRDAAAAHHGARPPTEPVAIPDPPRRHRSDPEAPSWERPRRFEAYPTIRSRIGLPSITVPPLVIGVIAVALAAAALFQLPALLGVGGPDGPTPTPTATATVGPSGTAEESAEPSGSVAPTPTPGPTPTIYVVASGDTMYGIALRFGITLEALKAANPQIADINRIDVGDEVIIPLPTPNEVPDAGSPSPAASAAP